MDSLMEPHDRHRDEAGTGGNALSSPRPPPPCLTIHNSIRSMSASAGTGFRGAFSFQSSTSELFHYQYDPTTKNRRTGLSIPGTGVPCGALSGTEVEDTESFLKMLNPDLSRLATYIGSVTGVGVSDGISTSRIFRRNLSGVELCVGQRPVLRFVEEGYDPSTGPADEEGRPLTENGGTSSHHRLVVPEEECEFEVTRDVLTAFCEKFSFNSVTGRAGHPGTLHRIARLPVSSSTPNMVTLRMGRRNASHECKKVAEDMCAKLWGRGLDGKTVATKESEAARFRSLLIVGSQGSGKTTYLREMARTLSDHKGFYNKSVVVIDTVGELSGCSTSSDAPSPGNLCGNARCIGVESKEKQHIAMLQALKSHQPDVVIIDELSSLQDADAVERVTSHGVAVVCTVHATGLCDLVMNEEFRFTLGRIETNSVSDRMAEKFRSKTLTARTCPSCFTMALILNKTSPSSTTSVNPRYSVIPDLDSSLDKYLSGEFLKFAPGSDFFGRSSTRKRRRCEIRIGGTMPPSKPSASGRPNPASLKENGRPHRSPRLRTTGHQSDSGWVHSAREIRMEKFRRRRQTGRERFREDYRVQRRAANCSSAVSSSSRKQNYSSNATTLASPSACPDPVASWPSSQGRSASPTGSLCQTWTFGRSPDGRLHRVEFDHE